MGVSALYSFRRKARPLSTSKTMLDGRGRTEMDYGRREDAKDGKRRKERTVINRQTLL